MATRKHSKQPNDETELGERVANGLSAENGPAGFNRRGIHPQNERNPTDTIRWRAHAGGHDVPEYRDLPRRNASHEAAEHHRT